MNFANIKDTYQKELSTEEYLQEERKKAKYDPRPDIKEDHNLWQLVLKKAEKTSKQLYGNLHGFRIAECRLVLAENGLNLVPDGAINKIGEWKNKTEWQQDRQKYLIPFKKEIRNIFKEVEKELKGYADSKQVAL
ncbi:MAG: hypothetical protein K9K76_09150 [Halanaerobiales bacterium]|nr:hypothetical protein [Halanaerobiales bacterium]